ncbi:hypothetical protein [Horticoccus sp. 23ND18S-11]|uniref:hypothetical protein n=1 Tax=Horticoccus sp. 23ND18S-11 TaxID=3391832 RepID=UPI0039C96B25
MNPHALTCPATATAHSPFSRHRAAAPTIRLPSSAHPTTPPAIPWLQRVARFAIRPFRSASTPTQTYLS